LWIGAGIVLAGMGSCLTSVFGALPPAVEARTVLELDLTRPLPEQSPRGALDLALGGTGPTLHDVVAALDRGARDEKVVGAVARVGAGGLGLAATQELRDAVARFRAAGKKTLAWSESFGGLIPGNGGYYLATAFEEVWLLPTGDLGLIGLSAEVPFLKGTFEKVGVTPEMDARHEHKTMKNLYTEASFTDAHREQIATLLTSQQEQLVAGIASARGERPADVTALMANAPYSATAALDLGLIDRVGYRDEVLARLDELAGGEAKRLYPRPYLERAGRPHERGAVIALVHASGEIQSGRATPSPLSGGNVLSADEVSRHIRSAAANEDVRAIVLRVDSPGGSHIASDVLRRAVETARNAGKPVVASMGNIAGSGGYMLAMAADRIVAQPGTLTGSIGVVGGKLVPAGLFEKVGVTWERIDTTPRSGLAAVSRGFNDEERAAFGASLDRIYADFVAKAAASRGLEPSALEAHAGGRVFTGKDAQARGLVDTLGGMHEALALARELAEIAPDAAVELRAFPQPRRPLEAVLAMLEDRGQENSDAAGAPATGLLESPPWLRALTAYGLAPRAGVLRMPTFVHVLEGL
jgi:protease-4